ncbi:MAG: hypothetical protein DWQ05_11335 [Calditrichaeota bacterium]|nr:MAG: hypothetical protein DWQ05_11335 [Calditrichota bacterium]
MIKIVVSAALLFLVKNSVIAQAGFDAARVDCGLIENNEITEASGIAASRKNANILWTHNDSGDKNRIFAINTKGEHRGTFLLVGAENRDWEDIAVGPGPNKKDSYIYIGDIGDNNAQKYTKYIYRVPEPEIAKGRPPVLHQISEVETFAFQYPDGNRDAEALLVHPMTKDIYIISKREEKVRVYCAPWPQAFTKKNFHSITIVEFITEIELSWVTAGDISPDGKSLLIKTDDAVFLWPLDPESSIEYALQLVPRTMPYVVEPLGEAICWSADGTGYFTLSEEQDAIPARLYYYKN